MKKFFKTQSGRFVVGLLALVLVVGLITGVNQMNFLKEDVTAQKVMSMSEESTEIARSIQEDVTIRYFASESGKNPWVDELAQRYASQNKHIAYELIDPNTLSTNAWTEGMMSISSDKRSAVIMAEDWYAYTYNMMYYYMYGELVPETQTFVADEVIANALMYVTRNDMPIIYTLNGHGESALGTMTHIQIQNNNVDVQSLTLDESVPENAEAVLICAPMTDLTHAEVEALSEYLAQGGDLVLLTNYALGNFPNLKALMAHYGMEAEAGVVLDTTTGYCYHASYPQYLTPDVARHPLTEYLLAVQMKPVMQLCGGLERVENLREGLTVQDLLVTSANAYRKSSSATTAALEKGDEVRSFSVAMAAEEGETRVAWFAGANVFNDADVQISSGINLYLMEGIMDWMLPETAQRLTIEAENLMSAPLSIAENQRTMAYGLLFVPALVMLVAFVVCRRMKKR